MPGIHRSILRTVLAAGLGAALVPGAVAQSYPTKPIRLIVGFGAGGGNDIFARLIAPKLSERLGQPVLVENKPGAGGTIAADLVAKSAPDGHTLYVGATGAMTISPAVFSKLSYDPVRDLMPISMASSYPFALTVHPSLPVRNVKELVALAKSKPGELAYASAGGGTMSHMATELLRVKAGIRMQHLPYKGAAPASVSLISGETQLAFLVMPVAAAQMKAGKLRLLAVAAPARSTAVPGAPTMREAGVEGHEAVQWNGFFAPARTPQPVIDRLHREVAKTVHLPDVKKRFEAEGATPSGNTPGEFAAFFKVEAAKWADVAKKSGTKLD